MIDLENSRHGLYADSKIETNCDFIQSTFRPYKRGRRLFRRGRGGERETENKKLEYNFMESKIN